MWSRGNNSLPDAPIPKLGTSIAATSAAHKAAGRLRPLDLTLPRPIYAQPLPLFTQPDDLRYQVRAKSPSSGTVVEMSGQTYVMQADASYATEATKPKTVAEKIEAMKIPWLDEAEAEQRLSIRPDISDTEIKTIAKRYKKNGGTHEPFSIRLGFASASMGDPKPLEINTLAIKQTEFYFWAVVNPNGSITRTNHGSRGSAFPMAYSVTENAEEYLYRLQLQTMAYGTKPVQPTQRTRAATPVTNVPQNSTPTWENRLGNAVVEALKLRTLDANGARKLLDAFYQGTHAITEDARQEWYALDIYRRKALQEKLGVSQDGNIAKVGRGDGDTVGTIKRKANA